MALAFGRPVCGWRSSGASAAHSGRAATRLVRAAPAAKGFGKVRLTDAALCMGRSSCPCQRMHSERIQRSSTHGSRAVLTIGSCTCGRQAAARSCTSPARARCAAHASKGVPRMTHVSPYACVTPPYTCVWGYARDPSCMLLDDAFAPLPDRPKPGAGGPPKGRLPLRQQQVLPRLLQEVPPRGDRHLPHRHPEGPFLSGGEKGAPGPHLAQPSRGCRQVALRLRSFMLAAGFQCHYRSRLATVQVAERHGVWAVQTGLHLAIASLGRASGPAFGRYWQRPRCVWQHERWFKAWPGRADRPTPFCRMLTI
jgi:hypothetical protein